MYTAEFILERGDAAGAVVGVMHSEFQLGDTTAGAKAKFHIALSVLSCAVWCLFGCLIMLSLNACLPT